MIAATVLGVSSISFAMAATQKITKLEQVPFRLGLGQQK